MDVLSDLLFGLGPIRAVQQFFGVGHPFPFRAMSLLGDPWGVLLVVGVGFWLYGRRALYGLIGITIFAAGTWLVVSGAFDVSRPEGPGIVVYADLEIGAFPSGHVTQAAATWGLLYAMGCVPLAVPVLAAALTGLGRIYLGAHFLGDVLGGMLYGALVVAVFAPIWRRAWGWLENRSVAFYLALAGITLAIGVVWLFDLPANVSERRVEVVVLVLMASVALPGEYRWLRYSPPPARGARTAAMVALGTAGLLLLRVVGPHLPWGAPLSAGLAVAWVVLGAPAIFRSMGSS